MKSRLFGSACGADVTAPQISRFRSGSKAGSPLPLGKAAARLTVPINVLKKLTGWPPKVFGVYSWVKATMSVAYSGSLTGGVAATMVGSDAGKVGPLMWGAGRRPGP